MNLKNIFGESGSKRELAKMVQMRTHMADKEFAKGYGLIVKYPQSVSILGSARFPNTSEYYKQAESLAKRIATELKYAIVTGAGPGIMEAANKGAYEAGGVSLGFAIKLPKEQSTNKYLTEYVEFEYFFSRKTLLYFSAEAYIYFPGGFGTLDEFFEIVTLIQTLKIPRVPVILIGKEFWQPILDVIKLQLFEKNHTIDEIDTSIYKIVETEDEIISIIKNAPLRTD